MELPAVNLSSDCDVELAEKQFQQRQHYIQNVELPRYILDDPVWVQDPTSKEWLLTTITGITGNLMLMWLLLTRVTNTMNVTLCI